MKLSREKLIKIIKEEHERVEKEAERAENEPENAPKQLDWMDKQKYGRLVESYEMTSLN